MSLPPGALSQYRAHSARDLIDTCVITRPTDADSSYGGRTRTYATVASDVPCLVEPTGLTPREIEDGGQAFTMPLRYVHLAHDTDVRRQDRIIANSRTLEVIDVPIRTVQITKRVLCQDRES